MSRLPIIGVSACSKQIGHNLYHTAGDKYLRAVLVGAGGMPLIIPALGDLLALPQLLESVDGLLFTGSPSNVEPHHYSGESSAPDTLHDSCRDATTLPLIRTAIDAGVPLLGICRGFQEINVALGGTLHQRVHEVEGLMDHREPKDRPVEVQYGLRHAVQVQSGGLLAGIGLPSEFQVNSIHGQGVARLAPGLRVEALAPDGLVEAFSVEGAKSFALGVQWHPEWLVGSVTVSSRPRRSQFLRGARRETRSLVVQTSRRATTRRAKTGPSLRVARQMTPGGVAGLGKGTPFPASRALPGVIWRGNAARAETATDPSSNPNYLAIFQAFGEACRERAGQR